MDDFILTLSLLLYKVKTMRRICFFILLSCFLAAAAQEGNRRKRVLIATNKGDITVELYNETPKHRDNFLHLCETHYYDSLLFHRVIENFMIQGGDPDSRHARMDKPLGEGGPGYTLPAEIDYPRHFHRRGALAAAREGDETNPERRSSGSQFYIVWGRRLTKKEVRRVAGQLNEKSEGKISMPENVKETYVKTGGAPHLDGSYTVFGQVVGGLDIVGRIQKVATIEGDRPFDDVLILSTTVLSD